MPIDHEILRKNIKYLRMRRGLNQDDIAAAIHITRTTYSSYESGTRSPDLQAIDALSNIYNISFESLVSHDLSDGLINRIYFYRENREFAQLLNDFQQMSLSSRYLISQRLDILLEKERALYKESLKLKYDSTT